MAKNIGIQNGLLQQCPNRDNCVNSDDPQEKFQIEAIDDPTGTKWKKLNQVVLSLPRTELISEVENYRHFTQTSKLMRFVDDIEFYNRPESGQIAIRSASRVGYSDWGVNRKRVETIRELLDQ